MLNTAPERIDPIKKEVLISGEKMSCDVLVSTVSPDMLFDFQYGELPYMGRDFMKLILPIERVTPEPYYFIHYANDEPFTRVFEYKLLTRHKSKTRFWELSFHRRK